MSFDPTQPVKLWDARQNELPPLEENAASLTPITGNLLELPIAVEWRPTVPKRLFVHPLSLEQTLPGAGSVVSAGCNFFNLTKKQ